MSIRDKLPGVLGFGGAPLGNMFRAIPEDEALATVQGAWNAGVRYFDTAPFYGSGLSELRMGEALKQYDRDQYVLSSKVGRLVLDEVEDVSARDLGDKAACLIMAVRINWSTITAPMRPCVPSKTASSACRLTVWTLSGFMTLLRTSTAMSGWSISTPRAKALSGC